MIRNHSSRFYDQMAFTKIRQVCGGIFTPVALSVRDTGIYSLRCTFSVLASDLLRESTNFVLQPAVGIHFLAISASDLLWESTKSVIGAAVGIHQFLHRSYCGNPCVYIIQSDGCISIIITTIAVLQAAFLLDILNLDIDILSPDIDILRPDINILRLDIDILRL